MTQYIDPDDFKRQSGVTDTTDDDAIERAINAASEWIDGHCGRTFGSVAASETRYFLPDATNTLNAADLATITTIKVDTNGLRDFPTTLATTDYDLLPLNQGTAGVLGKTQQIVIRPTSSKAFRPGYQVQIVGTWGYGSVPESVAEACFLLTNRLWKRHKSPFGTMEAPESGEIFRISSVDRDVLALLEQFKAPQSANSWVIV